MALMQVSPVFRAAMDRFGRSDPVPVARAAVRERFRSGADLSGVVASVMSNRSVSVEASPGAGKSVVFPETLERACRKLVVQVLPYDLMAVGLHRYLCQVRGKVGVTLMVRPDEEWPKGGIVVTSAACVVAKWLEAGRPVMPECYLLHDESHESGYASAALRLFGPVVEGVRSYVALTATSGPEGAARMETGGELADMMYEASAFADPWTVEESGAPWAVSGLTGHVLVFEDDKNRALDLVQAYAYNGVQAYRLYAGMPKRDFVAALDALEDKSSPYICVLVADSTFRSCHTFPVSLIVDSGKVRRVVVDSDGKPVYVTRDLYKYEVDQSRARGARVAGQRCVYWRPRGEVKNVMCDLEQTDVEALALVCRFLGHRPPAFALGAKMASGSVPRDLSVALRGSTPLACLSSAVLVDPAEVALQAMPVRAGFHQQPVSVQRAPTPPQVHRTVPQQVRFAQEDVGLGCLAPVQEASALPSASRRDADPTVVGMAVDILRATLASGLDEESLHFGSYYCAEGVATSDLNCLAFPEGVDSVWRLMYSDKSGTAHKVWSPFTRSVAVNLLVHSHNVDLMELRAYSVALTRVKEEMQCKDPVRLRAWASGCAERMSQLAARAESTLRLVERVQEGFCIVRSCDGVFSQEEDAFASAVVSEYHNVVTNRGNTQVAELGRMRDWVGKTTVGYSRQREAGVGFDGPGGNSYFEIPRVLPNFSGHPSGRLWVRASTSSGSSGSGGSSYSSDGRRLGASRKKAFIRDRI